MTQLTLFSDQTITPSTATPAVSTNRSSTGQRDSLLKLAQRVRDGRAAAQAQARLRSRPIQSIGDLAQSVLIRHDLVARRRAAANEQAAGAIADATAVASQAASTRVPAIGLAQTPAQVHVAS